MKKTIYQLGLWSMILALVFACEEDTVEAESPTASFQYTVGETDFLTVTFENFSQNYESSSWDFGDGSEISTEQNPVHTYEQAGNYDVTLTVTSASGETDERVETVQVTDPLAAQRALIGDDGKTWKLLAEPAGNDYPIWVGPNTNDGSVVVWFALGNNQPICERACIFDDTWTFNVDGTYTFENNGDFWAEGGVWPEPGCFDTSAPNAFVGADGQDLSGWDSGTHPFTYDVQAGTITVQGGFIGLSKAATNGEVTEPQESVTYDVVRLVEADVDTLVIKTNLPDAGETGGFWQFTLVSYGDAQPVTVDLCETEDCVPLDPVSPSVISHSFASNDASEWNLMQPIESASGIELGVDDPADATADKVGRFIRTDAQFQELQFKLDPANAINFENLTTITMDVYLPSTNDYSGPLTDNVFVGFGATECPPNWWEDLHQYEATALEKDTWVTVTFQLNDPTYVAVPENGATVYDRNDLDMIYIQIGGGDHTVQGEFFVRNFSIQ